MKLADTATFTYQCRLKLSPEQDTALAAYAAVFGRVERKLFAAWAAGARINDLKSAYLKRFGLTARQFNAIAIGLKGKIAAIEERRTGLIKEAEQRIARAREVIARLKKKKPGSNALHQKQRRLAKLQANLDRLQEDHAAGRVRLFPDQVRDKGFGARRLPSGSAGAAPEGLFRAQFDLAGNGYESHGEWLEDWKAARCGEVFVIGSKDETAGCQGCVASFQGEGTLTLRLRLPNALTAHGRHMVIAGVFFAYGHGAVLPRIKSGVGAGRAISYRFRRDPGPRIPDQVRGGPGQAKGWRVFATTDVAAPRLASVRGNPGSLSGASYAIAVDINSGHLAAAEIDRSCPGLRSGVGNLLEARRIACLTSGLTAAQAKARIGDAVTAIAVWAQARAKPIVIEKLDFARKKAETESRQACPGRRSGGGRRCNHRLSGFAYAKIGAGLHSAAFRRGIEVIAVNPAYTSIIGAVNYARRLGLSVHCAAAFAIARRGLRLAERPAVRLAVSPVRNGGHVAFALPASPRAALACPREQRASALPEDVLPRARTRTKHVWSFWSSVRRRLAAAHR
ncbi:MAG: hypothetical protein ACREC6_02995, partial [Hyphomicrobiaceae bacterium]